MAWLGAAKCVQSTALVRGEELAELSCPLMLCRAFGGSPGLWGDGGALQPGHWGGGRRFPYVAAEETPCFEYFLSFFSYKHVSS